MQILMLLSRTFIAAHFPHQVQCSAAVQCSAVYGHFPHQCLLGLLAGLLAVRAVYRPGLLDRCSRTALVLASIGLTASAVGVYSLLLQLGFQPQWLVLRPAL
jgi:hypothetical protein